MDTTSALLLATGTGLGLLHSFDADHIMAVSTLACEKPSTKRAIIFCVKWAMGHGGVLISLGILSFALGIHIPASISYWAEKGVGVMLIALGGWLLFRLWSQQQIRLRFHSHGYIAHTHLSQGDSDHKHTPVLVGITHGLAGSAPALALIPAIAQGKAVLALSYIALFSLGVMTTMFLFGVVLGNTQNWLQKKSIWIFNISRVLIAFLSVTMGGYWLSTT
jgi:high-affinity nickel permease